MTSPATLSLADLAAAVVRLRDCHWLPTRLQPDLDLLLAAANRLPAVVAECERLRKLALRGCDEGIRLAQRADNMHALDAIAAIRKDVTP